MRLGLEGVVRPKLGAFRSVFTEDLSIVPIERLTIFRDVDDALCFPICNQFNNSKLLCPKQCKPITASPFSTQFKTKPRPLV